MVLIENHSVEILLVAWIVIVREVTQPNIRKFLVLLAKRDKYRMDKVLFTIALHLKVKWSFLFKYELFFINSFFSAILRLYNCLSSYRIFFWLHRFLLLHMPGCTPPLFINECFKVLSIDSAKWVKDSSIASISCPLPRPYSGGQFT